MISFFLKEQLTLTQIKSEKMESFGKSLVIMSLVAIILKFIAWILILTELKDVAGFIITTPPILIILGVMANIYYNRTQDENKMIKSILLVVISSAISFFIVLCIALYTLRGYHG